MVMKYQHCPPKYLGVFMYPVKCKRTWMTCLFSSATAKCAAHNRYSKLLLKVSCYCSSEVRNKDH